MSLHDRSLTLVIPALSPHITAAETAALELSGLPALQRLLDRADTEVDHKTNLAEALCGVFGIATVEGELPVAALSALADRLIDTDADRQACWLRADPVNLRPDVDRLMLFEADQFALTQSEADTCIDLLNAAFADEDIRFIAPAPKRWYLRLEYQPLIMTTPPATVARQDIHAAMPAGRDARKWHALMNEIQMLLHDCPVNQGREAQGLPAVNSVWFWGAGVLPDTAKAGSNYTSVFADDSLLRGLAQLSGVTATQTPAEFDAWLKNRPGPGESIVMLDDGAAAGRYGQIRDWIAALQDMEKNWFMPILAALGRGRIDDVTLLPGDGRSLRVARSMLLRFWRRRRPLISRLTS